MRPTHFPARRVQQLSHLAPANLLPFTIAAFHEPIVRIEFLPRPGDVATTNTDDDDIDWIANEGIKISCIVNAIRTSQLKQEWEVFRAALLSPTEQIANRLKSRTSNVDPTVKRPKEITQQLLLMQLFHRKQTTLCNNPILSLSPTTARRIFPE